MCSTKKCLCVSVEEKETEEGMPCPKTDYSPKGFNELAGMRRSSRVRW